MLAGVGEHDDPVEAVARLGARLIMQQALEDEVTEFLGRERYARADGGRRDLSQRLRAQDGEDDERPDRARAPAHPRRQPGWSLESQVLGKGVARTHVWRR